MGAVAQLVEWSLLTLKNRELLADVQTIFIYCHLHWKDGNKGKEAMKWPIFKNDIFFFSGFAVYPIRRASRHHPLKGKDNFDPVLKTFQKSEKKQFEIPFWPKKKMFRIGDFRFQVPRFSRLSKFIQVSSFSNFLIGRGDSGPVVSMLAFYLKEAGVGPFLQNNF